MLKKKGTGHQEKTNQATENINEALDIAYMAEGPEDEQSWILDSGTSVHIINDRCTFTEYHDLMNATVKGIGKQPAKALGWGTLTIEFNVEGETVQHHMKDILYVPEAPNHLISVLQFEEAGGSVIFKNGDELIYTLSTEHHFSHLSRHSHIALRSHPTHPTHSRHLSINPDGSSDIALSDIVTNRIGSIGLALHDTRGLIDTSHLSYPCRIIVTSSSLFHNSDMTHIYNTFSCPDISPSHCFFCFGHDSSVHCRVRIASEEVPTAVYKPSPPVPKHKQ